MTTIMTSADQAVWPVDRVSSMPGTDRISLKRSRVHSYLPSLLLLPAALHVVLTDVVKTDLANGREQRKVFTCGA